jgi:glycosyltransferase involved in cell wall biosynthesis
MVVVDNGSTDRTREVVESFASQSWFPVKYVFEPTSGHSVALNRGCREADGEVFFFTDDDAQPTLDWMLVANEALEEKQAHWVFGPVIADWGNLKPPTWFGPETGAFVACLDFGPKEFFANEQCHGFAGVNHACHRAAIESLGLYDEQKGLRGAESVAGNDDDLYHKALGAKMRVLYDPRMRVNHLVSPNRRQFWKHIRNAWLVGKNQARSGYLQTRSSPRLFGIPRCLYRQALDDGMRLGWNLFRLDFSKMLWHTTRLARFSSYVLFRSTSTFQEKSENRT